MAHRTSRSVGAALRRQKVITGLKYTQSGYVRDGAYITEPGCEVTRQGHSRYGGMEDLGYVAVYPVLPDNVNAGPAFDAYVANVEAALTAESLPFRRRGSYFEVADEPDVETVPEVQQERAAAPPENAVRAAAEVIAGALYQSRQNTWENASREIRESFIDRAIPLARQALIAASAAY